jgi:hypothetical protein
VPRAVAPKGMFEPTVGAVASLEADAAKPAADMPELVLDDVVEPHAVAAVIPPPSKAAFELALQGIGLMPGVLSSVAPSGIPAEPDGDASEEEGEPSGDVAPIPGVETDCAWAADTTPSQMTATNKMELRRIGSSKPWVLRLGWPAARGSHMRPNNIR